ncbi:MAG: B12-binding domain-containing protein, partial [Candidatus Bathyarchaeia archaeon]
MSTNSSLAQAVVELKYAEIESLVQSALKAGSTPEELLKELKSGLDAVGEKYHNREYFLSELYMASETMKAALDIL